MLKGLSFLAATEIGRAVSRNMRAAIYFAIGGLLAVLGLAFLLQASHSWLAQHLTQIEASLVVAATLLSIAGILMLVGASVRKRRSGATSLTSTAVAMAPFAAGLVGRRSGVSALILAGVVLLGALAGRQAGQR